MEACLTVSRTGNMQEEIHLVFGTVPTHVALVWILVAVVTHVHGVHDTVSERDIAVGALVVFVPQEALLFEVTNTVWQGSVGGDLAG